MRKLIVPAGIGDSVWLLQLLVNQPEALDFILPGGRPRRGKQVFDLLPNSLVNSCEYSDDRRLGYNLISRENQQLKNKGWAQITTADHQTLFLSANEWLEQGHHLKDFFFDLPISYQLPWQTQEHAIEASVISHQHEIRIGIYGSSYNTTRAWGFWQEDGWFDLITLLNTGVLFGRVTFFIIGAQWDLDIADKLVAKLAAAKIKHVSLVGKPLGMVMEMMQRFHYAFYFPSGLPILSETLANKTPCTMFYPPHLERMMHKWCDPARVESGEFKECQFCEPKQIYEWVRDVYQLYDRV